jgi:hypothetical protein
MNDYHNGYYHALTASPDSRTENTDGAADRPLPPPPRRVEPKTGSVIVDAAPTTESHASAHANCGFANEFNSRGVKKQVLRAGVSYRSCKHGQPITDTRSEILLLRVF